LGFGQPAHLNRVNTIGADAAPATKQRARCPSSERGAAVQRNAR
jgi:hypothetical protein